MSISPLISGFGFTIGFGNIGPSSSNGGHLKSLPFKGGVQASAGGVTGAVPHIVKKNSGSISSLFIIPFHDDHWSNDSVKLTKVFFTTLRILTFFFLFSHLESNDRILICSISQLIQKSTR